jgi:gliding motility-associated-like protein
MRAFIELFNNGSLIDTTFCSSGCLSSITAKFSWGPDLYPVTGDSVFFTNESVGGYLYKWYIDSVLIDSTFNFRYRFDTDGVYEIMLKVSDSNDSCFANYSVSLEINCGVVARFSPNKRIIAAQTDVYSDPVTFFNKSRGATSYKWYVTNPATGQPQMISTSRDLVYDFPQPGSYSIFLEAANGACIDRSSSFNLPVLNPRPDGYVNIKEVDCYKKDSIRLVLEIGNLGYDTIPAGKEITFYDRDPRLPGASRVFNSYITSQNLIGKCSTVVTHIVSAIRPRLDTVFAYLDELRTFDESSFDNNIVGVSGFQFRVSVTPPVSTVNVNTTVSLGLNTHKGPPAIIRWTSAVVPSCLQCASPQFRITDTTLVKGYAENIYQCPDSATAIINVFPLDATVSVDSIHCYRNDSLRLKLKFCLRNNYQKIKYDLKIDFYDRDSSSSGRILLGKTILPSTTRFSDACAVESYVIKMSSTRRVFVYLNADLQQFEDVLQNNRASVDYIPFDISFMPPILEVNRGESTPIDFMRQGDSIYNLLWTPSSSLSCSTCFTPFINTAISQRIMLRASTLYQCVDSTILDVKAFYQSHISLPNIFTPNGDGRNDYFYVIAGKQVSRVASFQILSRWGETIFEISNIAPNVIQNGWNGTRRGAPVPQGTYIYLIVIELVGGEKQTYKGNVTVVR